MYRKTKQEKQGISLIVLVITIIVIIIIAAAIILGLTKSNPINNSKISQLVQSRDNIKSSITMYLSKVASNTQGSFTNIQMLTGLLGVPDNEDPIIKQGAEKYKMVYGKNSTPSYNTQTKIMYTQRTEVKLENGGTKFLYQIDPVAYKTQTENALDSAMFADAAWYVDPDDTQVYLIFNNKGSYPSWMLENDVIADPTLLGMLGKLSVEDQTNEQAKQEAENNVTEDGKPADITYTSENVPIPKGFSVSSTNNTLASGVVITDDTTADEYVWVPVPDISKFVRSDWQNWSGSGEPGTPSISYKELTTTEEYQAMYNSVKTYQGYYIARYEAGKPDGVSIKTDGSIKPVSKAGKAVWNNIPWSVSGTDPDDSSYAGDPNQNGAVKVARSVYPKDGSAKVVSTLIYGVQWDAAMRYVSDVINATQNGNPLYIQNSKGMGWYNDNYSTGNPSYQTGKPVMQNGEVLNAPKGIYDLGGNMWEWTMEAYGTSLRALRGGSCNYPGNSEPVSCHAISQPPYIAANQGFRVALYLK